MNSDYSRSAQTEVPPDALWPHILEFEYLSDPTNVRTDSYTLMVLPASHKKHRREALIDLLRRVEYREPTLASVDSYLTSIGDDALPIDGADVSLIVSIYEVLWADGDIDSDHEEKWLGLFKRLIGLDHHLGSPLLHFYWRMVRQAEILKGFPRWQLPDCRQEDLPDNIESELITSGQSLLASGWRNWFLSSLPRPDAYEDTRHAFVNAAKALDPSSAYYYSAVEAVFFVNRVCLGREEIGFWDSELSRRSNDTSSIITREINNALYPFEEPTSSSQFERSFHMLYRQQMLVERLALRYWQLDGFIRTVATFTRLIIEEACRSLETNLRNGPRSTVDDETQDGQSENDKPRPSQAEKDYRTTFLKIALYTAAWGWPFESVSRKTLSRIWPRIESLLVANYPGEYVADEINSLIENLSDVPDQALSRNPIITSLDDLLTDRALDVVLRHTHVLLRDRVLLGNPTSEVASFWLRWIMVADPNGPIIQAAVGVIHLLIHDLYDVNDLIDMTVRVAPSDTVNRLIETLAIHIKEEISLHAEHGDTLRYLFAPIIQGLNNRTSLEGIQPDLLDELGRIARENEPKLKHIGGVTYAVKLLGGHTLDDAEESAYLDDIVSHIQAMVSTASETNRNRWAVGVFAFPFSRPVKSVASEKQIEALLSCIGKLIDAQERSSDEVEGIFLSVGEFTRGVLSDQRPQIIHGLCEFAAAPKMCRNHGSIFERESLNASDGSMLSLCALRKFANELSEVELNMLARTLKHRPDQIIIDDIRHSACVLSAIATGCKDTQEMLWSRRLLMRTLFTWNPGLFRTHPIWPHRILRGIQVSGNRTNIEALLSMTYDWFQVVRNQLDAHTTSNVAYQLGVLSKSISCSECLNHWITELRNDPRTTVQRSLTTGIGGRC